MPRQDYKLALVMTLALAACGSPAPRPTRFEPMDPVEIALVVPAGESIAYEVHMSMAMPGTPPREQTQIFFLEHLAYEDDVESPLVVRSGNVSNAEVQARGVFDSTDGFVSHVFPTPPSPLGENSVERRWSMGPSEPFARPPTFHDSFQLEGEEQGHFLLVHRRRETVDGEVITRGAGRHLWSPRGMYVRMEGQLEGAAPGADQTGTVQTGTVQTGTVTVTSLRTFDPATSQARSAFLRRVSQARRDAQAGFDVGSVASPGAEVRAALMSLDEAATEILFFHLFGHPGRTLAQIAGLDESLRRVFFESAVAGRLAQIPLPPSMLTPIRSIQADSPSASHFLGTLPVFDLDALRATPVNDPQLSARVTQMVHAYESMTQPAALLEVLVDKLEAFPEGTVGRRFMGIALLAYTYRNLGEDVSAWRAYLDEHRDLPYVEWLIEAARGDSAYATMLALQALARALAFDVASATDAMREIAAASALSDYPMMRVAAAELLLRLGDARGIPLTVRGLGEAPATRTRAFTNLSIVAPSAFGFRPGDPEMERAVAIARVEAWAESR